MGHLIALIIDATRHVNLWSGEKKTVMSITWCHCKFMANPFKPYFKASPPPPKNKAILRPFSSTFQLFYILENFPLGLLWGRKKEKKKMVQLFHWYNNNKRLGVDLKSQLKYKHNQPKEFGKIAFGFGPTSTPPMSFSFLIKLNEF